jgi:hypothetical protein
VTTVLCVLCWCFFEVQTAAAATLTHAATPSPPPPSPTSCDPCKPIILSSCLPMHQHNPCPLPCFAGECGAEPVSAASRLPVLLRQTGWHSAAPPLQAPPAVLQSPRCASVRVACAHRGARRGARAVNAAIRGCRTHIKRTPGRVHPPTKQLVASLCRGLGSAHGLMDLREWGS